MHAKLHVWLSKNVIIPKPEYAARIARGCVRCKTCEKPIDHTEVYCSTDCQYLGQRKVERPSKEVLEAEMKSTSMVQLGIRYGVSDNAVRKWAKAYELI